MPIDLVKKYLNSSVRTPYFLFIGDDSYSSAVEDLSLLDLVPLKTSTFCAGDDKLPDIDGLLSYIKDSDANTKCKKFFLTGLGEYLALRGQDEAIRTLSRLKEFSLGEVKVVLLLRGLGSHIDVLKTDPRFDNRFMSVFGSTECNLKLTLAPPSVRLNALSGFKAMLETLEEGNCGSFIVNTEVNLDNALFTVRKINNAYEGVLSSAKGFCLSRASGSEEQWADLLAEINGNNGSIEEVFKGHGLDENLESNFYARAAGSDYLNWLYFVSLKMKISELSNTYLRFVLEKTSLFKEFKRNVLNLIIDINRSDERFPAFYRDRKILVEKFPESDIADFVVRNRKDIQESIYKLTDNTRTEREEIIAWFSQNKAFSDIQEIYPALANYLKKYIFKCSELPDVLTDYFEAYKRQKLTNELEPEFLQKVDELALSRKFNRLPTRNVTLEGLDRDGTYLYWLDALGVEYLAFIESLAQKRGLSLRVHIARAELPTITSINRDFFDSWKGPKDKNDMLDDIKHKDAGGYNFINNKLPIHLARELEVIEFMIEKAATGLALRNYKRFLVVSDHGASRLAVLRNKEEKYETDTKGEHSGRCCKLFQPYELPFAAEENGYLVLADYGRFKGSRVADVEVHGGASLEEVVIPIIELSLKDGSITVKLVDEVVTADFRAGTEINLFFNHPVQDVTVVLNGKPYPAIQTDPYHYAVNLPDIRRAGEYSVNVYAGDNLIDRILLKTQGKSGKINDAFDNLF